MRVTPLAAHAAARIPTLTDIFGDTIIVRTISVVSGGLTTIDCDHNLEIGQLEAISIVAAKVPNKIVSLSLQGLIVTIETEFDHDKTVTPEGYNPFDPDVELFGFSDPNINGTQTLVAVPTPSTFSIKMDDIFAPYALPILTGNELLFENIDDEITGWQTVNVVDATTLTLPTPSNVNRDYVITDASITTNVRCWATLDLDTALSHYSRKLANGTYEVKLDHACIFISPIALVSMSKDQNALSDGTAENSPNVYIRQMLTDGFHVYVFLPVEQTQGAVGAIDLCQGDIFGFIMKTFNGLKIVRPELPSSTAFSATLKNHGNEHFDGANYVHGYHFEVMVQVTRGDGIKPFEETMDPWQSSFESPSDAQSSGGLYRFGSHSFREIEFEGIRIKGKPQPLTAKIDISD